MDFYSSNAFYGIWIVFMEVVAGGIIPAAILVSASGRKHSLARNTAFVLAIMGVCINRWVMVLQVMAVPVMTFDKWVLYFPSWQEIATTILPVAYGVFLIVVSYRYLPIFPQEAELNPHH